MSEGGSNCRTLTKGSPELEHLLRGMIFSVLSITDDTKETTLKKFCASMPWYTQAMKMICGTEQEMEKPLSELLKSNFNLTLDKYFDEVGTKGGHLVDTQGYIAHNDDTIVLAFRCTTGIYDWMTNFNATTSIWEVDEDAAQGFSGYCSGFEGLCCGNARKALPRVHTGFYNGLIVTIPHIRTLIEPLLASDASPKTLYVVGHSLGGGVAVLASCYFLLEYDWNVLPHKLVSITAGGPRACGSLMHDVVTERMRSFDPDQDAKLYRIVNGNDLISKLPPAIFNFAHVGDPVLLQPDGTISVMEDETQLEVLRKASANGDTTGDGNDMKELSKMAKTMNVKEEMTEEEQPMSEEEEAKKYQKMIRTIPGPLVDHMPDFYLKPMYKCMGVQGGCGSTASINAKQN